MTEREWYIKYQKELDELNKNILEWEQKYEEYD